MTADPEAIIHVIDDEAPFRRSLVFLLESAGWRAMEHESAEAFLAASAALPAAGCLILDVRMPGISGLELQRRLAAAQAAWPIIFMTGHGDDELAAQAIKEGAVAFLQKPCNDATLLAAVERAARRPANNRFQLSEWQKQGISTAPAAP